MRDRGVGLAIAHCHHLRLGGNAYAYAFIPGGGVCLSICLRLELSNISPNREWITGLLVSRAQQHFSPLSMPRAIEISAWSWFWMPPGSIDLLISALPHRAAQDKARTVCVTYCSCAPKGTCQISALPHRAVQDKARTVCVTYCSCAPRGTSQTRTKERSIRP